MKKKRLKFFEMLAFIGLLTLGISVFAIDNPENELSQEFGGGGHGDISPYKMKISRCKKHMNRTIKVCASATLQDWCYVSKQQPCAVCG